MPVPAAIITTFRWAGGGFSLSCRKGPCNCTAGLSKFWNAKIDIFVGRVARRVVWCHNSHETVTVSVRHSNRANVRCDTSVQSQAEGIEKG